MVLSNFMTEPVDQNKNVASKVEQLQDDHRNTLILDVSRAFCHFKIKRTVHCELPEEDKTEGEDQVKTMHGTRDASAEWEGYYSEVFERAGEKTGLFSLRLLLLEKTKLTACVHVGTSAGVEAQGTRVDQMQSRPRMDQSRRREHLSAQPLD